MDTPSQETASPLRRLRQARQLSQAALSEKSGISRTTLQKLEKGMSPSRDQAEKLARVLDVNTELFNGQQATGRKMFVLDTSVILYAHDAILNFQEHDVAHSHNRTGRTRSV